MLDYWEPGRMMLSDPGAFLNSLVNFDKENMSEAMISKLEPYINNPNFQPAKIITVWPLRSLELVTFRSLFL